MSHPIRIKFCENVDHFVEAQGQQPPSPPIISEKAWRFFAGILIGGAILAALVPEYRKGTDPKILVMTVVSMLLVMAFWLWFFKKMGWYKQGPPATFQWTEKDRARFKRAYVKQTGREETKVICEFNEQGFSLGPENEKMTAYDWSGVKKVVEGPKGILVFIRKSVYFWFPRRVFETAESYRELLNLAERKAPEFQRLKLALVALGSNLGKSREAIESAITQIKSHAGQPLLQSSLWETTPVNCPPGSPKFLNAVVGFIPQTGETPESLLAKLQALEKKFGRVPKKILNEPRPLDLDLIAFGNEVRNSPPLTLPHPRAHLRRFVLQPLSEIAGDLVLPEQTKTVAQLLAELPPVETVERIA